MQTPEERARIARENGAKSKGPKTPEGKAASSRNAIKTGEHATKLSIYAPSATVLCNEDRQRYFRLIDQLMEIYLPVNQLAQDIVKSIADTRWQIERLSACITMHWNLALVHAAAEPLTVVPELAEDQALVSATTKLYANQALAHRLNRQIDQLHLRIARLERRLRFVESTFPNVANPPVDDEPAVENTELTPDEPEEQAENEPVIYVNEKTVHVIEAYRLYYPGRKIVVLPPDNVAKGIDVPDDMPSAPRKAA